MSYRVIPLSLDFDSEFLKPQEFGPIFKFKIKIKIISQTKMENDSLGNH